jgi:hypothetical protein
MDEFSTYPEFEEKLRQAIGVPDARPEFVNHLRNELARRPAVRKPRFVLKPAWVFAVLVVVLALVASAPSVVNALKRMFGYLPGVGLVETTSGLRMLAEPVNVTRQGVTLTVESVLVYPEHVELIYSVKGIAPSNDGTQAEDASTNPTAFCGGVNIGERATKAGDAVLRLPDGALLERDRSGKYPQNAFAMKPVYEASVPAQVMEMTMLLDCIPWARLGAVPENWELPLKLAAVPAGSVVGQPVIEVEQPAPQPTAGLRIEEPAAPTPAPTMALSPVLAPVVTMNLEKIVPTDTATIFYFSLDLENPDPSLVSVWPLNVSVIDSLGQKIPLVGSGAWQPFEHRPGSLFEYISSAKPADGPLTLVVEKAIAYYAPLHVDPPQARPEEISFTFDAGDDPQRGQVWELDEDFEIAGYNLKVTSARAVTWEDVQTPEFIDGSQGYEYGYQFKIEADPSVNFGLEMGIVLDQCGFTVKTDYVPSSSSVLHTELCRDEYPKGLLTVTPWELYVLIDRALQATWTPPAP